VGYGKDTPFIAQLKANSRRVILFDEVEKAAKGVLDNLLNMLDEGNFTTARGEELDLTSAIIILSSNALADQFHKQTVGFSQTGGDKAINDGNIAQRLIEAKAFSPEFVNRMDDVVVFSELSDKEVDLIARKGIEKIIREFSYRNITVKADIEALIKDINKRANKMLGGRDVMRLVDRVGKNLAHKVLENPNVSEIEATV
jgi:ATP-dependent Clp protease ATP-binding subunit ClpC